MTKMLDIVDSQLELGDVKTITSNGGATVKFVELLFSSTTRVQFAPSKDRRTVRLAVSDSSLELPQLDCLMNKQTLRDYIISLKNVYNQLLDEEESN